MPKIKIDPVTRIEGHLRIEAEVSGGSVTEAWASGTMFRGIEKIVEGKDAGEAWPRAQRVCGMCTTVHTIASVRAVEDAIGATPPPNAELVPNLIARSQLVHDHVIHFYDLPRAGLGRGNVGAESRSGQGLAASAVALRLRTPVRTTPRPCSHA